MARLVHTSEHAATTTTEHDPASTAMTDVPTKSPAKAPARKVSRANILRRQWSHRDRAKKKSLPTALPSFSYGERRALGPAVAREQTRSGAAAIATGNGSATASGDAADSATPTVAPLVKSKSRATRATDVLSRLSSQFFYTPRRSSDSSTKQGAATAPSTSEERRFWPRRFTNEKKVVPALIAQLADVEQGAEWRGSADAGDASSKSDAVRHARHTGAAAVVAAAVGSHTTDERVRSSKARVNPHDPLSAREHLRHDSGTTGSHGSASSGTRDRIATEPLLPSAVLEPPFTAQQTLEAFGNELTALEKSEVLQHDGAVYFFSSLSIKSRRRDGKIHAASSISPSTRDVVVPIHAPLRAYEDADVAPTTARIELFNDGYDDARGDYLVLPQDHLAYRFEVLHVLGAGSFGQVVCCVDHATQQQVAVKIIRNRTKYREQSLVEVQIVAQLQAAAAAAPRVATDAASRIVQMHTSFEFRHHLCIVLELLGPNLYECLKRRFFQGLALDAVRRIAVQLVDALRVLERARVVHCDLKPENILVRPAALGAGRSSSPRGDASSPFVADICVIDFGSSCVESAAVFTYIQSRFYRSPEVILGMPYARAIDMWSLGCILVELHTGVPLFAGESETEQLACIMELLGAPSHAMLILARRRRHFFTESAAAGAHAIGAMTGIAADARTSSGRSATDRNSASAPSTATAASHLFFYAKPFVNSRGRKRTLGSRSFASAVQSDDWRFVEFVRKCLALDPRERLTPEQAARDPWLCAPIVASDSSSSSNGDNVGYSGSSSDSAYY